MQEYLNSYKNIDLDLIKKNVEEKGYFSAESFFNDNFLKNIERDATKSKFSLNQNSLLGFFNETQYYFINLLAQSKDFYNFCTSKFVLDICKSYLGNNFRLKALRYYETMSGHNMKWHTDNKVKKEKKNIPGLIFIIYISDVNEGEFQYIEGSHKSSGIDKYSEYNEKFVNEKYIDLIKTFTMPKGSLIIYDSYGIHRAKPFKNSNFVRKSIFFQVDSDIENSEKIIVNTNFLKDVTDDIKMYLGFGRQSDYFVYPDTNLNRLPISKNNIKTIISWFLYRTLRFILRTEPRNIRTMLRKLK
jgi:hypothetical protein